MTSADRPAQTHRLRTLRAARAISALVTVAALVALAVAALSRSELTTRTTIEPGAASSQQPVTGTPSATPPAPSPGAATTGPPTLATAVDAARSMATVPAPAPATAASPPSGTSAPSPRPARAPVPSGPGAPCPFALPAPQDTGGLASLIGLAPAFGPFSSEAFAMAAAYQPLLTLFGPLVAQVPSTTARAQPTVAPLVRALESLENDGFTFAGPLYGSRRQQVLELETHLATALAPYAEALAESPAGACLVDLEGMLVAAAHRS